jgi:hypothetical protein
MASSSPRRRRYRERSSAPMTSCGTCQSRPGACWPVASLVSIELCTAPCTCFAGAQRDQPLRGWPTVLGLAALSSKGSGGGRCGAESGQRPMPNATCGPAGAAATSVSQVQHCSTTCTHPGQHFLHFSFFPILFPWCCCRRGQDSQWPPLETVKMQLVQPRSDAI